MATRIEVTRKYARTYMAASKKQKGAILDTVVEITGWYRDHARQELRQRARAMTAWLWRLPRVRFRS